MAGIACAGHWVIDHVKFIDYWPKKSELCNICSELISNGGAPFNIVVDLANLKVKFPFYGIGCIGDDPASLHILQICKDRNISTEFLQILTGETTSYTDVMTTLKTGIRTMFHYRGANSKFSCEHVPFDVLKAEKVKIFYLGHLLLMDALEAKDNKYHTVAGRMFNEAQEMGMQTVLDIATESSVYRYRTVVIPTLPYVDHFVLNELEAEKTTGIKIRKKHGDISLKGIRAAAIFLLEKGVRKNVIIHMPEGAYWRTKKGKSIWYPSFIVPTSSFKASCGAGDAFCCGILVGLHEKWRKEKILKLATAAAAAAISSPHNSDGIMPLKETMHLADKYKQRDKVVYGR